MFEVLAVLIDSQSCKYNKVDKKNTTYNDNPRKHEIEGDKIIDYEQYRY